ncbi:Hemicentin-2 [Armadillidium vulgare]|nr:Hemicentin-2 [Armadillidium vulgare]
MKEIPLRSRFVHVWRQGLKPDPQVYVRVTEAGMQEAEPISIEISGPSQADYGSSVLWFKNGESISSSHRFFTQQIEEKEEGELVASLNVISIREGANYTCRVPSKPDAEASFKLDVRVAKIESLRAVPSKDEIQYGQNLTIECVVSGTDSQILWFKDGGSLDISIESPSPRKRDDVLQNGNIRSTLVIENFSWKDNGQYSCYVPGDSKGFLINIEGRLPRVLGVKGWDFVVGEVLRLTCSTQYAKGEKKVIWLFKGEELRSDWWAEEVIREDAHNITHHDLSLPIPTRAHVGSYTCTAPYGSASTIVREIVPPYVEESPPVFIKVPLGDRLSLPCTVVGYPIPTVLWEKNINGQWKIVEEAKTEGDVEAENFEVKTEPLLEGEKQVGERQELLLDEAMPVHEGNYRCRGYNEKESVTVETQVSTHEF